LHNRVFKGDVVDIVKDVIIDQNINLFLGNGYEEFFSPYSLLVRDL